MELLSTQDREAKTRRQLVLVDTALIREFSTLPANVVHREVGTVSDGLLANARFTDHVAVLTGRYAAEHLRAALPQVDDPTLRSTDNQRQQVALVDTPLTQPVAKSLRPAWLSGCLGHVWGTRRGIAARPQRVPRPSP